MHVADREHHFADLTNIKIVKKIGGLIEDSQLVHGIVFPRRAAHTAAKTMRHVDDAKIALVRFHLSPPKTDMDASVVVSDYAAMDRVLREERQYVLKLCKDIRASGANVVFVQKSVLRDAVSDLALHFLAKMKILVVKDIDRDDMEFISQTCGAVPVATVEALAKEKLGNAELVEERDGMVYVTGCVPRPNTPPTCTILIRGSNKLVLEEADRSIHDALCVIRCLVKKQYLLPGGGAAESEVQRRLSALSTGLKGTESYAVRAFADAFETIPVTLAENAGLDPIATVTELRACHARGEVSFGINVIEGKISDMFALDVVQPLVVTSSAISLATEAARAILKVDDIAISR
eukprot:gnl/Ergobibamus_cyprinoides/838.p1 GENE.gnl/Ergobibamus_cyprinoides/838~~gnl/Ergobibamus_cyprinoides/838.p1  ORF type:complete len:373 (+),score=170.09 gnl/Ergobibamus_cyprinoides/838:73-1119(+)